MDSAANHRVARNLPAARKVRGSKKPPPGSIQRGLLRVWLQARSLPEHEVEHVARPVLVTRPEVAVDLQCDGGTGVAEEGLHLLHGGSTCDQGRGSEVPQIVSRLIRQPSGAGPEFKPFSVQDRSTGRNPLISASDSASLSSR